MLTIGTLPRKIKSFFSPLLEQFTRPAWAHFWRLVLAFCVCHGATIGRRVRAMRSPLDRRSADSADTGYGEDGLLAIGADGNLVVLLSEDDLPSRVDIRHYRLVAVVNPAPPSNSPALVPEQHDQYCGHAVSAQCVFGRVGVGVEPHSIVQLNAALGKRFL